MGMLGFKAQSNIVDEKDRLEGLRKEREELVSFDKEGKDDPRAIELKRQMEQSEAKLASNVSKEARIAEGKSAINIAKNSSPSSPSPSSGMSAQKAGKFASGAKSLMDMKASGDTASDVGSGAMTGVAAGAEFGPKGAIIGGLVGAGMGALKAKAARKAAQKKAFDEFQDTRAKIAGDKADREKEAFSFLGQAFQSSLL